MSTGAWLGLAGVEPVSAGAVAPTYPEAGLERRVLASTATLMVIEHRMRADWVGTRHSHPHEQAVYIIAGRLKVAVGGNAFQVNAGDSFVVPGGVEHQAAALEASVVLDVFTPAREEYL